ncbi:hypothetical protein C3L33_03611, partial [Rhododendron williamsianum]
ILLRCRARLPRRAGRAALGPWRPAALGAALRRSVGSFVRRRLGERARTVQEVLPPALDSTSDPPAIFDGTTRLYISYSCPYAQRCGLPETGLQDKIKLVPIDLQNRPTWYKEKVYPPNKVKSLNSSAHAAFDYFEMALSKFDDGPFLLAEFSLVDIAYAPFIERFQPFLLDLKKYDITAGRPKLAAWIKEMNKNVAYKQTQRDPKEHVSPTRSVSWEGLQFLVSQKLCYYFVIVSSSAFEKQKTLKIAQAVLILLNSDFHDYVSLSFECAEHFKTAAHM